MIIRQARIMAAQERAKQTKPAAPAPAPDLLSFDDTPAPAFDAASLPPPTNEPPPPAFDDAMLAPAPTSAPNLLWDPMEAPPMMEAPTASAPDIGDLLSHEAPLPTAVPPPTESNNDAIEAILGLEGLSESEKQALMDEQLKIMAAIEKNKNAAAHNAADAFEARSFSANVRSIGAGRNAIIHGPERSQQAIQDGTALQVECIACGSWMQVTAQATLMNCPVCSTVQPVTRGGDEEDAQMKADMELAERLQQEEYQTAERAQQQRRTPARPAAAAPKEQGWMEWLGLTSSGSQEEGPERPTSFARTGPVQQGQVGVSRPPGSSAPRLTAVDTGTSGMGTSVPSYDSYTPTERPTARVAQSQPLFSCVADSVSTALNAAIAGSAPEGVDHSSLLAMPQVRREEDEY